MKLVVLTYGTEGDTRPLIALSHGLRAAGHDVHLLGEARTLGLAHALSIPATGLSGDVRDLFARWGTAGASSTAKALAKLTNDNCASWMRQTLDVARGCDAIITSGLTGFVGMSVAESLNVPVIGAGMIPLTPSREFPSPFVPFSRVPGWLNKPSLVISNQLFWFAFKKALNQARAAVLRLPPRTHLWVDEPMLYGMSPTILPRPRDWPASAYLCGQWVPPQRDGYMPPPALSTFLAKAPAPIYMGFGSMTGMDMPKIVDAAIQALDGRPAIFSRGWQGLDEAGLPKNIFCIDHVPHEWLFPQVAAVIHHGGSGTTHSALRAGKPAIVMPFVGDQHFWAGRLQRLGVAPAPVSPAKPDATALARAIRFVERESVVARAAELGKQMQAEDGVANAVCVLERLLKRR